METQRKQVLIWSSGIREDFSEVVIFELGLRVSSIIPNGGGVYKDNNAVIPDQRESPGYDSEGVNVCCLYLENLAFGDESESERESKRERLREILFERRVEEK